MKLETRYNAGLKAIFPVLPKGFEVFELWLSGDVQTTAEADSYLRDLAQLTNGASESNLECDGNAWSFHANSEGATVETQFLESFPDWKSARMPLDDVISILEQWRAVLVAEGVPS